MSDEPVFDDVLDAAAVLDELEDLARRDVWGSSVLGVWAEDADAARIDDHFRSWLGSSDHPRAGEVATVVDRLLRPADGDAMATTAWVVRDGATAGYGIEFRCPDDSEHALLADIEDGELVALVAAPGSDQLFTDTDGEIAPEPCSVAAAAVAMVDGWSTLVARRRTPAEDLWVNGALARARLRFLVEAPVDQFARPFETGDAAEASNDTIDPAERAELNAWALSVLDGAGVGPGAPGEAVLVDPLDPTRSMAYPAVEQEAFAVLEWADWLGVVLGLVRAAPASVVEPAMLVDLVNRCPEVTSTIPKQDRPYVEWAWSMVVPLWRDGAVIDADNRLTDQGAELLVWALRTAWATSPRAQD